MFDLTATGPEIDKAVYKEKLATLREALLDAQYELQHKKSFPVVIIVSGVNGAGKSDVVKALNTWMDPRHIQSHALGKSTQEELERPAMWKFWRCLPRKGAIAIFFGSWYSYPMRQHIKGAKDQAYLDEYLDDFMRFEQMLCDEGALILKFWLHRSKDNLKARFTDLESHPNTKWQVSRQNWKDLNTYDNMLPVAKHVLEKTSTEQAPWIVVSAQNKYTRDLTVGKTLLDALHNRLNKNQPQPTAPLPFPIAQNFDPNNLLKALDLSQSLDKKAYKKQLAKYQKRLHRLVHKKAFRNKSMVIVFEGNDAAGKGGTIRRVTESLDPRLYEIVPICAPNDEERAQPYLWRFWRKLPRQGHTTIFDRSWYGRVLVERVEGLLPEKNWRRGYGEINDFERTMNLHGVIVFKFWLAISPDEQLTRFKDREATGYKRFKLTDEDWRNRSLHEGYVQAVCDMVDETSTQQVPWTLIEANSKYFARIKVLKTICKRLKAELK
ncbi:MAG: polyphosphate:AMP phosphotransferase [Magnetovibrio sp.]|nr:polyphosphate:AMP phosphotransferase [Magnetovibrio sp.]